MLDEMIEGIKADQAAVPTDVPNKDYIDAIFEESSRILKQIKCLSSENCNKSAEDNAEQSLRD